MSFDLSNYVDVKTRIKMFYERYPEGSLQFEFKGASQDGKTIWGIAYAYRSPEDPRPSTGTASELAQGKTAFTAGSELMNLETSAIGRAIGNLGIGIEAGMASSDEVQFAKERQREIPAAKPYDPWEAEVMGTMEQALTAMGAVPECACGVPMKHKSGTRKSDGKPYSGFFCANNSDNCKPLWDK
jgi:hypothetical protein